MYSVICCSSSLGRALDMWKSQSAHCAVFNNIVRSPRDVHEQLAHVVSTEQFSRRILSVWSKQFVPMAARAIRSPTRSNAGDHASAANVTSAAGRIYIARPTRPTSRAGRGVTVSISKFHYNLRRLRGIASRQTSLCWSRRSEVPWASQEDGSFPWLVAVKEVSIQGQ